MRSAHWHGRAFLPTALDMPGKADYVTAVSAHRFQAAV